MAGGMTAPRQVLEGTTYLITHRCFQRQFLLKPTETVREVFHFLLAVAACRYGVQVHAYCVLSNHYHLVVTDPKARLPAFQQFLGAFIARAVNASLGRRDHFWEAGSYSAVTLVEPGDVVEKVAYTLANPVAARLVQDPVQWPGLWSSPASIGAGAVEVKRPARFFDPDGEFPETQPFELETPVAFSTAQAFRGQVEDALAEKVAEAGRSGGGFLGLLKIRAQRPTDRPRTDEPARQVRPKIAAKDKGARVEAIRMLKAFLATYQEALLAWRDDAAVVVFPAGTYLMRVAHGVACAGAG
jgi:REP element-mobilizing transposase RayT